jgi:hypothetical protein
MSLMPTALPRGFGRAVTAKTYSQRTLRIDEPTPSVTLVAETVGRSSLCRFWEKRSPEYHEHLLGTVQKSWSDQILHRVSLPQDFNEGRVSGSTDMTPIMNIGRSRARSKLFVCNKVETAGRRPMFDRPSIQVRSSARVSSVCILPGRTNSFAHAISIK